MKQFFEQYGGIVLGILALLVLIAMITPVGNIIKTSLQGTVQTFSTSINAQVDVMSSGVDKAFNEALFSMSSINSRYATGDFSQKGNLVKLNNVTYRILEVDDTTVKLLSLERYKIINFNDEESLTDFNGQTGQKYENSILDQEMANFYSELPVEMQNSILEVNLKQSIYFSSSGLSNIADFSSWWATSSFDSNTNGGVNYYLIKRGEVEVGLRKVFVLDLDEIIDYLGTNSTAQDVNEMFFGIRASVPKEIWTRSSRIDANVFNLCGSNGNLANNHNYSYSLGVQPAFVIDIKKLIEEENK